MYPYWNPMILPYYLSIPPQYSYLNQAFYQPSPQQINFNYVLPQQIQSQTQITKNNQRTGQELPIQVIQISDSEDIHKQLINTPSNEQNKSIKSSKLKNQRHLGFKEGIFQKKQQKQNQHSKINQKQVILTRSRLKRNKQKLKKKYKKCKNHLVELKEKPKRNITRPNLRKKQKVKLQVQKIDEKKQKKKFINRLKRKMQRVQKTVQISKMYILSSNWQKIVIQKKDNLLLRKICLDDIIQ